MEIGNTSLKNYTIELDVGGDDPTSCRAFDEVTFGFSPSLHYIYEEHFGGRGKWYAFESNEWELISRSEDLECGHMEIVVQDNRYIITINGQLAEDLIFDQAEGPLLVRLEEGVYIDNFQINP